MAFHLPPSTFASFLLSTLLFSFLPFFFCLLAMHRKIKEMTFEIEAMFVQNHRAGVLWKEVR